MSVGSKYKFYIPYQLAYGEQGSGEMIPGGSLLVFEVELIDIVKGQN
jgi:FKBP-type peptidyl-prolyl cis-trans isomerase